MILELNNDELQALVGLIDAGVRATGIRGVKDAANLIEKIESAQQHQPEQDDGDV